MEQCCDSASRTRPVDHVRPHPACNVKNNVCEALEGVRSGYNEPASDIKQCDANCSESCDNSRIYITGLTKDVTVDELQQLFGGIGQVGGGGGKAGRGWGGGECGRGGLTRAHCGLGAGIFRRFCMQSVGLVCVLLLHQVAVCVATQSSPVAPRFACVHGHHLVVALVVCPPLW
eukprot:jgi/Mesvir1/19261/Mv10342-RA.1